MTSRRSFLQVLGMAPVAGPMALKAAADQMVGQAAGVASGGLSGGLVGGQYIGDSIGKSAGLNQTDYHKKLIQMIAENALPEWYEEHLREEYGHVAALDPDIASKRSWSINVKISAQRQRNIARGRANLTKGGERQMRRSDFFSKTGLWL